MCVNMETSLINQKEIKCLPNIFTDKGCVEILSIFLEKVEQNVTVPFSHNV